MSGRFQNDWWQRFWSRHMVKVLLVSAALVFVLGGVAGIVLGGLAGWGLATTASEETEPAGDEHAHAAAAESSEATIWTCSMHPQIRQPKPGQCPICGMDLIPAAKSGGGMRTLVSSPEAKALMNIQTSPVERRYVTHKVLMVGKVDYDETRLKYITAWIPGRLDRLYVDYTGVEVKKGDHMVYLYSEALYSAQEELIQSLKYERERGNATPRPSSGISLVESAREKLRLLGLPEEEVKQIEQRGTPSEHMTIYSPIGGIVVHKNRQEGERVSLGDRIYTVADLSQVWVNLDAYESDLVWLRYGQEVVFTTEAYPGEEFKGRIAFIQPVLDDKTRTVKVRVNVPNAEGKLKPEMFVRAMVRPKVAAGGRVMDPALAGKWICPMHPEIVKDEPDKCDICGMPLVRAESLGYAATETDPSEPPLVIPKSAALVTGTRAVVYLELPSMHTAAEPAFQTLSSVVQEGKLDKVRSAFATYGKMLDRPYDQPGTDYAKRLWNEYADRLGEHALAGQRAQTRKEAEEVFNQLEAVMGEVREQFAPPGQPTFEGREIVLGPRAGDYYLARHGLEEGQLVVTQGTFKIDSEIQLQAKPSMMTPEGGGGEHAGHQMTLPSEVADQLRALDEVYDEVTKAIKQADPKAIHATFEQFGQALAAVDGKQLTGETRSLWKELAMLLGNDVVEGVDAKQLAEADRVYLLLKGHMRRMREQLGVTRQQERRIERIAAAPEFQIQLARLWQAYLPVQDALASDDFAAAKKGVDGLKSAAASIDAQSLDARAMQVWRKEGANIAKVLAGLAAASDIETLREAFSPLSDEIGVLAKTFGFGEAGPVYELHCPMAFQGRGATWYQNNDQTRNPYYGATMLQCADRVEPVATPQVEQPSPPAEHKGHEQ